MSAPTAIGRAFGILLAALFAPALAGVKLRDWETSPDLACRKVPNFVALPEPTRGDLCQACDHLIPCTALGLDVARVWGIAAKPDDHTTYGGRTLDRIARAVYR